MSVQIIRERLAAYQCRNTLEEDHALREITQEVVLAALGRGDFYKHALFQGGTSLRVFHGLNRFSEDLDFMLDKPNSAFQLGAHLRHLTDELAAFGYTVEIVDRSRAGAAVQVAFLKDASIGKLLELHHAGYGGPQRKLRIKLEVDTNPPAPSGVRLAYLDFPFVTAVPVQDLPSLFAGTVHALLCRPYTKGRDWYDFIWYTSQGTPINECFLRGAINQSGRWAGHDLPVKEAWILDALTERILQIDWPRAAQEVRPFLRANEVPSLDLWSQDLFLHQLRKWARTVR